MCVNFRRNLLIPGPSPPSSGLPTMGWGTVPKTIETFVTLQKNLALENILLKSIFIIKGIFTSSGTIVTIVKIFWLINNKQVRTKSMYKTK